jgi:hypothetical protein
MKLKVVLILALVMEDVLIIIKFGEKLFPTILKIKNFRAESNNETQINYKVFHFNHTIKQIK